jgi:nucleoid-associated protein YgaU
MKRYSSTQVKTRWDGKRVYFTTQYPIIEPMDSDIVIISTEADYLDSMAYKYYGDPTLWWIIALTNNLGKARMSIPPGLQLRIPTNINEILVNFSSLNANSNNQ